MGNIIPFDSSKKEECEEIAKEFVATFGGYYVLYYGVELVKMKMKEIENDANAEEESEKKLMYREDVSITDPLTMGHLTKRGGIIRKQWKTRYFVVNPDFTVSYYESEEAYNQGSKPKGKIVLAGYNVEENADNAKLEKMRTVAQSLGVREDSITLPTNAPPNTLVLSHDRRRKYYLTAENEEEKMDWVEMFKTCARKTKGFKNKDPVGNAAFMTAYREACKESNWKSKRVKGGTEVQILSETLAELVNDRVMASAYNDVVDNLPFRTVITKQVMKVLDRIIIRIVKPAYKGLAATVEKMKPPIEKTFDEKKDDIIKVYKQMKEKLMEKIEAIMINIGREIFNEANRLYDDLKELSVRTTKEMRKACVVRLMNSLIEKTKRSENVEETMQMHYKKFNRVKHKTNAWDHWYKVFNMEMEIIGIIDKYESTFGQRGNYDHVYTSHEMLAQVADAAFYTFELTLETYSKENDIYEDNTKASTMMKKVKNEVLLKYDYDSQVTPHEISFKITTDIVKEYFITKAEPMVKEILKQLESFIPKPLEKLVSIRERYHLYVEESVKNSIKRENNNVSHGNNDYLRENSHQLSGEKRVLKQRRKGEKEEDETEEEEGEVEGEEEDEVEEEEDENEEEEDENEEDEVEEEEDEVEEDECSEDECSEE